MIVTEDAAFFDHDGIDSSRSRRRSSATREGGAVPARRQHDHAAAREEPLPVAVAQPDAQADGAAHHAAARGGAQQAAHPRDLPERDRVGRRHLRLRGRGARLFRQVAADSTPSEAALLAGAIINPRVHSPAKPTRRLLRRQQIILRRMGQRSRRPTCRHRAESRRSRRRPVPPPPEPPPPPRCTRSVVSERGERRRSGCASTGA